MTDQQYGDDSDDLFRGLGDSDDLDDFSGSSFPATSDPDLPDTLEPVEAQGPNRTFVIGLVLLVVVVVLGLIFIVFSAAQTGIDKSNRDATTTAIVGTNNAVMTSIAGTATAKSWTLTPSSTPSPTTTATNTPSDTPTATITPSPSPTATNEPGVTPPTATVPPPPSPAGVNNQAITTQSAQLQAAQTVFAFQETLNARSSAGDKPATRVAKQTQNAEFGQAQTAVAAQLTLNANALAGGGSDAGTNSASDGTPTPVPSSTLSGTDINGASGTSGTGSTPTPASGAAASDVPTNTTPASGVRTGAIAGPTAGTASTAAPTQGGTVTPTLAGMIAPVLNNASLGGALVVPVLNVRQPDRQPLAALAQDTAAPAVTLPSAVDATLLPALVNATATAAFLDNDTTQLQLAQTALAGQLTSNAALVGVGTPGMIQTSNAQIGLGQTAVAGQLSANADARSTLDAATQIAKTGLYEDLAAGRAAPGSLALLGLVAVGLVGLIVAARRLRVKF